MKKTRIALVMLSLVFIASMVLMGMLSASIHEGKIADNWIGVLGLLMTGAFLANLWSSYCYAMRTGRSAGLWTIGTLFLPYIIPIVLALIPMPSSGIEPTSAKVSDEQQRSDENVVGTPLTATSSKPLFSSVKHPDHIFRHKEQWHLDQLRLFCIIVPGDFKWRVVTSSQEFVFLFPDLLPSDEAETIYGLLDELLSSNNPNDFSGISLCLADYQNQGDEFSLHKMKKTRASLLAGLYKYRQDRVKKLQQWLADNPQVILKGGLGSKAILDQDGFHVKKKTLAWPEVNTISVETMNGFITHMFVLPEGRSGGMFDLKKGKYSLARIPTKKKNLYVGECNFWKVYCSDTIPVESS